MGKEGYCTIPNLPHPQLPPGVSVEPCEPTSFSAQSRVPSCWVLAGACRGADTEARPGGRELSPSRKCTPAPRVEESAQHELKDMGAEHLDSSTALEGDWGLVV